MTPTKGFIQPTTSITFGVFWFVIAIIYIVDKLVNGPDIRLWDWIGWISLFTAGLVSFIEGIKMKKVNKK